MKSRALLKMGIGGVVVALSVGAFAVPAQATIVPTSCGSRTDFLKFLVPATATASRTTVCYSNAGTIKPDFSTDEYSSGNNAGYFQGSAGTLYFGKYDGASYGVARTVRVVHIN